MKAGCLRCQIATERDASARRVVRHHTGINAPRQTYRICDPADNARRVTPVLLTCQPHRSNQASTEVNDFCWSFVRFRHAKYSRRYSGESQTLGVNLFLWRVSMSRPFRKLRWRLQSWAET